MDRLESSSRYEYPEYDILSVQILLLDLHITDGRGSVSDWMHEAEAIRGMIREVRDGVKKDDLTDRLERVVKMSGGGDILTDIWALESSVTSGRGSVTDWVDEAEAIRRWIQGEQDGRMKDNLTDILVRVVERIKERYPMEFDICRLDNYITYGRGSVSDWTDEAEAIRREIQGVRDGVTKDILNKELACVIKKLEYGDILTDIWALESDITSGPVSVSDWIDEAGAIRGRIQGLLRVRDGGMKDVLSERLERVAQMIRERDILTDIRELESYVTSGRGSVNGWIDEVVSIRRKIQGVQDGRRKDDLNDELSCVIKKLKNRDILTEIWALESSVTSGRGSVNEWMDEAKASRRRIQGLWRVWDGGMKDVLSERLEQVVQMVKERDSVDRDIKSLESSVTSGRGSVSDWMDEAQAVRRRIHGIQDDSMRSNLNSNLEHVGNMNRERDYEKQSIQEGIASFQSDATSESSQVRDWEEQVASIRERIRMFKPDLDKEELNNDLSTAIRECVKVKTDSIEEDISLFQSHVGSAEGTISEWVGHLEGIKKAAQELRPWYQYHSDKKKNMDGDITRVMEMIRERVNNMTGSVEKKLGLLQSQVSSMEGTIGEWVGELGGISKDVEELDPWYQYDDDYSERKADLETELARVAEIIKEREKEKKSIQGDIEAFLLDTSSESGRLREWEAQISAIREKIRVFQPQGDRRELNNGLSTTIRERVKLKDATKLLMFEVTSGYSTISDWIESAEVIWKRIQKLDQDRERSKLERDLSWVTEEIRKQADVSGSVGDIVRLLRLDVTRGNGTINQWKDRAGDVKKKIRRLDSWEERNKEDNELSGVMTMIKLRALRSVEHSMELLLCDVASGSGSPDEWKYRAEVVKEMIHQLGFSAKIKGELEGKLSRILTIINKRGSTLHLLEDRQLLNTTILIVLFFLWSLYLRTNGTGSLLGKRSISIWQVLLLRCGDVESNPGPNQFTMVMAVVLNLLVPGMALIGKTECQLKSSSMGNNFLEVHCSATYSGGVDGDINCYIDSVLVPHSDYRVHKDGMVTYDFLAYTPNKINCCSVNGTAAGADSCLDFVDEHPTAPPITRSPPTSVSNKLSSSRTTPARTTQVSSTSPDSSITPDVDGSSDETPGVGWTSGHVIAIITLSTAIVGSLVGMIILTLIFTEKLISVCTKINSWKLRQMRKGARDEGGRDAEKNTELNGIRSSTVIKA